MRVSDLVRLYDYNYWANARILAAVAQLTPEQFTQPVAGSYESVRNTLVHVLSAEWGWLDRCGGHARGERLTPERYVTLNALVEEWDRVREYLREFLSALTDDDLQREVSFTVGGGPASTATIGELMQHAALHAVHHRGQVALLLRQLGYAPGNFDFVFFVEEQRGAGG